MFNSTVKSTRDFWRAKFPEIIYLRDDASYEITDKRIKARIDAIPKRPRFRHWPTMYWSCRRLGKDDVWWARQADLIKQLWRQDLSENSFRYRS